MSDSMDKPTFPDMDETKEADVTSDIAEDEGMDVEIEESDPDVDVGDNIEGSDIDADDDEGSEIGDDDDDDNELNETESVSMDVSDTSKVKSLTSSSSKQMSMLKLNSNTSDDEGNLSSAGDLTDTDTDTEDDLDDTNTLQKFDQDIQTDFIQKHHPEVIVDSREKVNLMTRIKRNKAGLIEDPFHKTHPFMSRYEITHLLGLRAKQIEHGAPPLITVPSNIMDGYQIARLELQNKKIPFIIKRPLPGNKYEYWHARDLEVLRDI